MAGIQPGEPDFKKVQIEPHLEGLNQLKASMPHPDGTIEASYHLDATGWVATVTLPLGLDGQFTWEGKIWPLHSGTQTLTLASE